MKARLLIVALLGFMAEGAQAEQWLVTASAGSSAVYDDNPRLLSVGAEAVYGLVTSASLDLSRETEQSRLGLVPRVVARRYTGDYALDSDDLYLNLDYVTRPSDRSEYSVGASYSRDGTLTSEFVPTGFVAANVPREVSGVRASASRGLTELTSFFSSAEYQDVQYQNGLRYGLLDYQYWSVLGYVQRSVSERTGVSLVARVGLLDVPLTGGESQEVTVGLGLDRNWSERWRSSFYLGPTFSEVNGRSNGTNTSYRADIAGTWERSVFRVAAERLLSPDAGRGRLETRDQASASIQHGLTEQLRATATATVDYYSDSRDPRNKGGRYRSFTRIGVGLAWRASTHWIFSAGYEFSQRDDLTDASNHALTAGLNWSGLPRTIL